jgi:hypothetical protein
MGLYVLLVLWRYYSMARSYRRTFIETAGDIKNMFAHKVFCAWDFSTATSEAASLKSKSIYNELKVSMQPVLFSFFMICLLHNHLLSL